MFSAAPHPPTPPHPQLPSRFHAPHAQLARPFGSGRFGDIAETIARNFGTPQYLVTQTVVVIGWVFLNAQGIVSFDPYPFILLNLAFSLQSAYSSPFILLAETRQAERDKAWTEADARHREELAQNTMLLLQQNTELTARVEELSRQVRQLTGEIHLRVVG
jgi:uncharacterized membrane protein